MSVERQLMMSSGGVQQYTISNSLRFRASASAYLSRTFSSPTSQYVWTFSAWVKRGVLGSSSYQALMATRDTGSAGIWWWGDTLTIANNGAGALVAQSTAVFRDPSAWYHVVVTSNGTTIVGYVNNQQVLSYTGTIGRFNTAVVHNIANDTQSSYYFDGYLTEINFIDGQALTPSSFGATDTTTGVWVPKKYTGSYGTNGFYLNFNNNTSTTALGYDTSGNSNNWTPNNFSLTTGSTYDSMIDSPTSYASGTNNVGNYAVLNPLANSSTLVDANLRTNGGDKWSISTIGMTSGKWYCEVTVIAVGAESSVGISSQPYSGSSPVVGGTATSWGYYSNNGNKFNNTSGPGVAYGSSYTTSDVIGIALDADAGTLTFYKNNVSQGTAFTGLTSGPYYFAVEGRTATSANNCAANFGQRPFAYTPPSGYNALNTYNLSTPSIVDGSKQFAASLYTGTGSSLSVSGANFTPGMVWVKSRSAATNHKLTDVVRGVTKALVSNSTAAETTDTNGLTAFNSNGFTVGTDTVYNNSGATYVGWQWKAGGTAVTNTDGSITSSVSANQTAGFSVVTYTMPVSGTATIGHGLGVAPSFIIMKQRAGTAGWATYHASLGNTKYLLLQTTDDAATLSTVWNNTSPTTLVWTVGTAFNNLGTYVAYCFAAIPGYSAFGSYTGNGSSDGPFVYCGFRPRWIMVKCSSNAGDNWFLFDTSRDTYNVSSNYLSANQSQAEGSAATFDFLSNGFKLRQSGTPVNGSGYTYIYACFAENPFKYSLAR